MADSGEPEAGPSNHGNNTSRTDADLLQRFVMEYLQSHGFDKLLELFQAGIADQGDDKDAEGEEDAAGGGSGGQKGASGSGNREAVFRAPMPVPIESIVKRNLPQAQAMSASTLSERVTPEFEAQARYIIEMLQKKAELKDVDGPEVETKGKGESLLDSSDRVKGYQKFRRWVDNGLDMWKPELDALSFPIFAHTFLDLLSFGFDKSARNFFEENKSHHMERHSQEISTMSGVLSRWHLTINSLCKQLRSRRYNIVLSQNAHDLLLQWLSGGGLDEEWESGLHTSAGRAKEAVKGIVMERIKLSVSESSSPLDKISIVTSNGLLADTVPGKSVEAFNSATTLKLGPVPMTEKLREQVVRTVQDEDAAEASKSPKQNGDLPNGDGHADADGDVAMEDHAQPDSEPVLKDIKLEPEIEDPDELISPAETETNPPVPPVFRIADLKREVEAVRDRRKMIRLGANAQSKAPTSATLPSIVAFTLFDNAEGVSSVEFSQDSSLMAAGSPESCIRLWNLKGEKLKGKSVDPIVGTLVEDEGLPMRKLIGHSGPVYSVSFDPIYGSSSPPQSLLSSSQDGSVRLWSLATYSNLAVYRGHTSDPVWDVEWGPMGVYFATASRDRTARLWSSDRIHPLRMYTGHLSDVNCVKFHPNSMYLASGSNDSSCRLWDVQRGACVRLFMGHSDAVTNIAISPDGRTLASAGLDCNIWLWDLGSSRPIKKMTGHSAPIQSLSFSEESSLLVSGGLDSTVRCWDVKSAGGAKVSKGINGVENSRIGGMRETGELPMGGPTRRVEEVDATSDLLATFHTKRTPIIKTHHTPRNLCMVAGSFVPPSSSTHETAITNGTTR